MIIHTYDDNNNSAMGSRRWPTKLQPPYDYGGVYVANRTVANALHCAYHWCVLCIIYTCVGIIIK